MNNFVKRLIAFSAGPIIGAGISFITIPLTTYFISPEEYGKASLFVLFQMLFATIIYLGLDQSYTREYNESDNKKVLLQNALIIPLLLSLFLFLLIAIFHKNVSLLLFKSEIYTIPVLLFGIMIIFMVTERFILLSVRMEEKALEYSILNILVKFVTLIGTLVIVYFVRRDFLTVIYSATLGQIIGDMFLIIKYRDLLNFRHYKPDFSLKKNMLKFGLPILVAASITSLLNSLDRIFLRTYSDFYQLGIYTATLRIVATLNIVQNSFTSFWVPTAYRWHQSGKDIKYFKIVSDGILFVMSMLFMFIVTFKDFIVTLLSSEYIDAKFIVAFLCLQPIMYTVSETTCLGIVFSRKSYMNIWISLLSIIPNIVLNILLTPIYGAIGTAIATAVSYFVFFWGRTYFSRRTGLKFNVIKHLVVFCLVFVVCFINLTKNNEVLYWNILLTLFIGAVQYKT
ncbi:lipopolysaccharide biosynthesis protein, partial [Terribacillus saccharophilus]